MFCRSSELSCFISDISLALEFNKFDFVFGDEFLIWLRKQFETIVATLSLVIYILFTHVSDDTLGNFLI